MFISSEIPIWNVCIFKLFSVNSSCEKCKIVESCNRLGRQTKINICQIYWLSKKAFNYEGHIRLQAQKRRAINNFVQCRNTLLMVLIKSIFLGRKISVYLPWRIWKMKCDCTKTENFQLNIRNITKHSIHSIRCFWWTFFNSIELYEWCLSAQSKRNASGERLKHCYFNQFL